MGTARYCLSKYNINHSETVSKFNTVIELSTCLIPLYVLLSVVMPCLTKFVQLEFSSIVLNGHRDGVNAVKFDVDISMLLSGGMSFVYLPSVAHLPSFRQLWFYNCMGLRIS